MSDERYPDPLETANDFNNDFLSLWRQTPNYKLWRSLTAESHIFDIVDPRHPTAGGLNIEDVQRRVSAAVAELNLDEKVRQGREQAGKALEAGRERVGLGVARFWKEVESFKERREQSRARSAVRINRKEDDDDAVGGNEIQEHKDVFDARRRSNESTTNGTTAPPSSLTATAPAPGSTTATSGSTGGGWASWRTRPAVDTSQVQAAAKENAVRAGAYLSSWGSWARDKSREWQESRSSSPAPAPAPASPIKPSARGRAGSAAALSGATAAGGDGEPVQEIKRQATAGTTSAARSAVSLDGKENEK